MERDEREWVETNANGKRSNARGRDEREWKEVECKWGETNSSGARRMEKAALSATVHLLNEIHSALLWLVLLREGSLPNTK